LHGISRQAVYQRLRRHHAKQLVLEPVKEIVHSIRRLMPRLGTRKLYYLMKPTLEELGIKLGRDGLFDYLRANRLLVPLKGSYTKTTYSKHWMRKYLNLFQELNIYRPEQAFVSDITYVESGEGVHYLSLVTDAYSCKIVGHHLSHDMKAVQVVKALK